MSKPKKQKAVKPAKKPNRYVRDILTATRWGNEEFQDLVTKASVYDRGDNSKLIRRAVAALPLTKKEIGK